MSNIIYLNIERFLQDVMLLVIWLFILRIFGFLQIIEINAPLPSVLQTPEEAKEIATMEQSA